MASAANKRDWGEASDISLFHGRTKELTLVKQKINIRSHRVTTKAIANRKASVSLLSNSSIDGVYH
ncbi:MAG: hypothetical protein HXY43_04580 [Fischerella sp.]|jgi:hypothetical protein|nr:hypothetical protein [Fischerella sp.]